MGFGAAIVQILLLDMVFSIDSILTAVGMNDHLPVMIVAVIYAVGVMMFDSEPLGNFIARNPTVVMLALSFMLMIGVVLIDDGIGAHVPKGRSEEHTSEIPVLMSNSYTVTYMDKEK